MRLYIYIYIYICICVWKRCRQKSIRVTGVPGQKYLDSNPEAANLLELPLPIALPIWSDMSGLGAPQSCRKLPVWCSSGPCTGTMLAGPRRFAGRHFWCCLLQGFVFNNGCFGNECSHHVYPVLHDQEWMRWIQACFTSDRLEAF